MDKTIERLILEGKYQDALAKLEKEDLNLPNMMVEKGRALVGLGEFQRAAEEFQHAATLYSNMKVPPPSKREKPVTSPITEVKEEGVEEQPIVVDQSPLPKPKYDWYQSNTTVFISIVMKNIQPADLTVRFEPNLIEVSVVNQFHLNLIPFALIDNSKSTYTLNPYKVELSLLKQVAANWPQLESSVIKPTMSKSLPTPYSSKKSSKDWIALEKQAEAEKDEGDPLNELFRKIYKDADDDTRRAMIKSFQTSGGTVLTTNWKDAEVKNYEKEIKPPKGQVYKSWEGEVISNDDD